MIYVTAISVVKNPADAEEVAQQAVLKAFSNLASFRSESKFSTWLGWSNEEITEGVLVASLYACANRFSATIGLVADF